MYFPSSQILVRTRLEEDCPNWLSPLEAFGLPLQFFTCISVLYRGIVEDHLLIGPTGVVKIIRTELSELLTVTDVGPYSYFLGLDVKRRPKWHFLSEGGCSLGLVE